MDCGSSSLSEAEGAKYKNGFRSLSEAEGCWQLNPSASLRHPNFLNSLNSEGTSASHKYRSFRFKFDSCHPSASLGDPEVFCIYTGIALADVCDLRMDHITEDRNGTKWIKNKRLKTSVEFMVPILPIPQLIIEKYSDRPRRQTEGKVIPTISNQNYNGYLKKLPFEPKPPLSQFAQ